MKEKTKEKYYTAMNDVVFKNALCTEENKDLLKWLLEKIIHKKIEDLIILNNELPVNNYNQKGRTLDVLVKTPNEIINIEVNSAYYSQLPVRNAGYLMSDYVEDLDRGEDYEVMNTHIQINFTKGLPKDALLEDIYMLHSIKRKDNYYIENFIIIEYNIDKLLKYYKSKDLKKKEEAMEFKHLIMLDLGDKELKEICKGDEHMEKFRKKAHNLNKDEEMRFLFSAEEDAIRTHNTLMKNATQEGIEQGIAQGLEQGIAQGIEQGVEQGLKQGIEQGIEQGLEQGIEQGEKSKAVEIAKNLLGLQMTPSDIAKATGLSETEVIALKKE